MARLLSATTHPPYLPVWAAVVFTVLTIRLIPRSGNGSERIQKSATSVTLKAFVKDVTLVFGNGGLESPLWSLRWEILFSLALPIFIWIAIKWRAANWIKLIACFAMVSVATNEWQLYMPMFLVGSIIAVALPALHDRARAMSRFWQPIWGTAFAVSIILLLSRWLLLAVGAPGALLNVTTGFQLAGAAMMVLVAIFWHRAQAVLSRSAVQWLGRISFSLYLVHEPIVIASGYVFGPGREWLAVVAAIPIALGVAWAFHRYVEKPSHRLARAVRARSLAPLAVS
ncbi:MAG: hypothetical protein JWM49_3060 [Microbacteriaceae bacterium]|nr:hypothetical protein [Microbacteriaceae bacterium]